MSEIRYKVPMKITILGSGTISPNKKRNCAALVIETRTKLILVDIGPGTMRRLTEADIDPRSIDYILVTHFHPDHVTDLISFWFTLNYAYGEYRTEPMTIIGPQGMNELHRQFVSIFGHWVEPRHNKRISVEIEPSSKQIIEFEEFSVISVPANHHFPSLSYRINVGDKSITISGDSDFSEDLIELARGTNVLVCDTSFPDEMKHSGHMTPTESAIIASRSQSKQLVMTHLYPPCDEIDIIAQAKQHYSGKIMKAEDLMVLNI